MKSPLLRFGVAVADTSDLEGRIRTVLRQPIQGALARRLILSVCAVAATFAATAAIVRLSTDPELPTDGPSPTERKAENDRLRAAQDAVERQRKALVEKYDTARNLRMRIEWQYGREGARLKTLSKTDAPEADLIRSRLKVYRETYERLLRQEEDLGMQMRVYPKPWPLTAASQPKP